MVSIERSLISEAARHAEGGLITVEHLDLAAKPLLIPEFDRGQFATKLKQNVRRSQAKSVVERSIARNRPYELLALGMSVALFMLALFLLLWAAVDAQNTTPVTARLLGGMSCVGLLLIPFRYAVEIRRHNMALQLLGHLLDQTDDDQQLGDAIAALLGFAFPSRRQSVKQQSPP